MICMMELYRAAKRRAFFRIMKFIMILIKEWEIHKACQSTHLILFDKKWENVHKLRYFLDIFNILIL
jgi:hypothetical protein